MFGNTKICWGIPVQFPEVAAHVETFVEHEIVEQAFRDAVQKGQEQSLPVGTLSHEMVARVMKHLGPPRPYGRILRRWQLEYGCCTNHCEPLLCLSREERKVIAKAAKCHPDDLGEVEEWIYRTSKHLRFHKRNIQAMFNKIGWGSSADHPRITTFFEYMMAVHRNADRLKTASFFDYNKVLQQIFGLRIHFTMVYDDEFARDPTDVKAYLIKPPSDQEISSSNEPSLGSKPSLPDSKADQTMLQEPAADLQKQFQRAMIRLMLKVDVTGDDHTPQASTSARTTTTSRSASGPAPQKYPANPENKGPKLLTLSTLHIEHLRRYSR